EPIEHLHRIVRADWQRTAERVEERPPGRGAADVSGRHAFEELGRQAVGRGKHVSLRHAMWLLERRRGRRRPPGRLPARELFLERGDALLVALEERPLANLLAADEAGLGEHAQVFAGRRLADAQLLGDEDAADAVVGEVAVLLGAEVRGGMLQPPEDLEAP